MRYFVRQGRHIIETNDYNYFLQNIFYGLQYLPKWKWYLDYSNDIMKFR
jgi:hypothetical protein